MHKKHKGLGINILIKHHKKSEIDLYIKRLAKLGVEWVRLELNFAAPAEPPMTEYFVRSCKKQKIKILGLISSAVPGTLKNLLFPEFGNVPVYSKKKDLNRYVTSLIRRFGFAIDHWEILNEVNTKRFWVRYPSPNEYTEMLKSVSNTIRKLQPRATILFAGLVGHDDRFDYMPNKKYHFFSESMKRGARKYFDIANFHLYGWGNYFSWRNKTHHMSTFMHLLERSIETVKRHTDKPIWITEFGMSPKWIRLTSDEIAHIYTYMYTQCRKRQIPIFLWTLNDWEDTKREYEPLTPETCFGLLDKKLKPKPVFTQLVNLLNIKK